MENLLNNLTDGQRAKIYDLERLCHNVRTYLFKGLLIEGNYSDHIIEYVKLNPDMKFRTWLHDHKNIIKG